MVVKTNKKNIRVSKRSKRNGKRNRNGNGNRDGSRNGSGNGDGSENGSGSGSGNGDGNGNGSGKTLKMEKYSMRGGSGKKKSVRVPSVHKPHTKNVHPITGTPLKNMPSTSFKSNKTEYTPVTLEGQPKPNILLTSSYKVPGTPQQISQKNSRTQIRNYFNQMNKNTQTTEIASLDNLLKKSNEPLFAISRTSKNKKTFVEPDDYMKEHMDKAYSFNKIIALENINPRNEKKVGIYTGHLYNHENVEKPEDLLSVITGVSMQPGKINIHKTPIIFYK